jgi:hypothetical protein
MSSDKEPKKDPKVENIIDEEEEGDSEEVCRAILFPDHDA